MRPSMILFLTDLRPKKQPLQSTAGLTVASMEVFRQRFSLLNLSYGSEANLATSPSRKIFAMEEGSF